MGKVIGLDIGGTKITGVLYSDLKAVKELTIVTPKSLKEFEKNILKLVDFLSAETEIQGIGIGMAGYVDNAKGVVVRSPNIPFIKNLNIVNPIKKHSGVKVLVDNDANCFTRAELKLGYGKSFKNFLCLTLGTGVGGGIVIDKKIYRGYNNAGGELGHIVQREGFMEKAFQVARDKRSNSELSKVLGKNFSTLINIFAPEAIILGGGVSTDKTRNFIAGAVKESQKYLFNKNYKTKVLVSKLKNPGALGAALLVI